MTDPNRQLRHALDTLDAAFAPLSDRSLTVEGCTHCYAEADLEALAGPVHRIPEDLIASAAARTPGHWSDFPALYRRMTPRIIRLLVRDRLHVDHGLIASRLLAADWRGWTAPEREALEEVWRTWWHSALQAYPAPVTDVLEILSVSTGSLEPWLAVWAQTRTDSADRHLHDAIDGWLFEDQLADLRLGFYDELHATPELPPWLLALGDSRIGDARLSEVKRIASG
ncbi:hypothetical protein GA0115240_114421 [Streptomyces sp. DvalAA-14]|uniref:hypothetical protein n=1 Tax=unclassified Streptomyces TaxID=2593676 RepID=UPI00081B7D7C|nr:MULTISPECIES: hypothetical protein [unclassified Streptomyces]MYS19888.1 hypothetical protein [Streptomyces sp. SID4948]SCD55699.1 hypothetical protein GA0115240_114421 [Streptomyces sp. DvalAA-14]